MVSVPAFALEPPVLRTALEREPATLDWSVSRDGVERFLASFLMRGMLKHGPGGKLECDLCETWDTQDQGRTLRFTLKSGVQWSDGVPLTPQHFLDEWARLGEQSQLSGSPTASGRQITIKLTEASALYPHRLTQVRYFPVRKELLKPSGDRGVTHAEQATLGPYVLAEWSRGKRLVLEGNPKYEGERPVYRVDFTLGTREQQLNGFRSGRLDLLIAPTAEDMMALQGKSQSHVQVSPYWATRVIQLNTRHASLAKREVRRGLLLATERAALPAWLKSGERAGSGLVPPGLPGSRTIPRVNTDLGQAKALLASLPPLELIGGQSRAERTLGQALTESYLKSGITVKYVALPEGERIERVRRHRYDLALETLRLQSSSPLEWLETWLSDSPDNSGGFTSVPYDSRVRELIRSPESPHFAQWLDEALQTLEAEEVAVIPLSHPSLPFLLGHRVVNFGVTPFGDPDLVRIKMK